MKWASDIIPAPREPRITHEDILLLRQNHPLRSEADAQDFILRMQHKLPVFLWDATAVFLKSILTSDCLLCPERLDPNADIRETLALFSPIRINEALDILAEIIDNLKLPGAEGPSLATVPLIGLIRNPRPYLNDAYYKIAQTKTDGRPVFPNMSPQLIRNSARGEGRYENPIDSKEPLERLLEVFFKGTPFLPFLQAPVPFVIPTATRLSHTHLLAPTFSGKTRTLTHLIYQDIMSRNPPAVVVIEPKGELVEPLSRLRCIQDRLLLIDPTLTPPLNIFKPNSLDEDAAVQQYEFAFKSTDQDIEGNQALALRNIARLIIRSKGNLLDFKRLLSEDGDLENSYFRKHICELDDDTYHWFEKNFFKRTFGVSKQALANKVQQLTSNSHSYIKPMLEADDNVVDLAARVNAPGTVTLINTAEGTVPAEASEFLGRWFISQTMAAALERRSWTEEERLRRPIFLYVDEAQSYFSADMKKILHKCRSMGLGLVFAHQDLGQLEDTSLRSAVLSAPATRIACPNGNERREIAALMNTSEEHLKSLHMVPRAYSEFAVYVRNITDTAMTMSFPHTTLDNADKLNDADHEAVRERFRWKPKAQVSRIARLHPREEVREIAEARNSSVPKSKPASSTTPARQQRAERDKEHTEPTDF